MYIYIYIHCIYTHVLPCEHYALLALEDPSGPSLPAHNENEEPTPQCRQKAHKEPV